MAVYYLDSSAVTKYYVTEPGSAWVRYLIETKDPTSGSELHLISVAEITRVEVSASLSVIERVGRIRRSSRVREYQHFNHHLTHRYTIISVITADYEKAAGLAQTYPLKAYDAIQLAVAIRYQQMLMSIQQSVTFISGDKALNNAAQAEELMVDNPFDHIAPEDLV